MAAGSESTMPRYSVPSAYPRAIDVFGKHGPDLVAIMQRAAGVGHHDLADVQTLQDLGRCIRYQPDLDLARLDGVALHDLDRQMVDRSVGNRNAAAALGIDAGA